MNEILIRQGISKQLEKQLNNFWIDIEFSKIEEKIDIAYERCMTAISATNDKYLNPNGISRFSLYHSGCWAVFLYYLSNSLRGREKQRRFFI